MLVLVMLAAALCAAGWFALRRPWPARRVAASRPATNGAAVTALNYAQLLAIADTVKRLQLGNHHAAALPGARRLLEQYALRGRLASPMLVDFGRILNNAAFEGGRDSPRSSYERIALEREALDIARRALQMAKTPRDSAEAITFAGLVNDAWGFPYDALLAYRAAMRTDSTDAVARQHYDLFVSHLTPTKIAHR